MTAPERADQQRDDIARYVLGEMTLDEQIVFEVRMAENDGLARSVTAAMAIDEHLQLAAAHERDVGRRDAPRRRPAPRALVAAAIVVLAIGVAALAWRAWPAGVSRVAVAVLPTPLRYEQFVAELGMRPAEAPNEAMRGDEAALPDGAARVDALLVRAREQQQRAVAAPAAEVRGEAFVVPLTTEREVWLAVVGAFDDGSAKVYFPDAHEFEPARAGGRLLPGTHILPGSRVTASPAQRERGVVAFSPGFVVPLQQDRVAVLVLVLPSAPSASDWQRVRDRVAQPGGDLRGDLAEILPAATCSAFVVRVK